MLKKLLLAFLICIAVPVSASERCFNIYLRDGSVIKGVKYRIDKFFGQLYVTYWRNPERIMRISRNRVSYARRVKCSAAQSRTRQKTIPLAKILPGAEKTVSRTTKTPETQKRKNPVTTKEKTPKSRAVPETAVGKYVAALSTGSLPDKGYAGYRILREGYLYIKWDDEKWAKTPLTAKRGILENLSSEWPAACKQDGIMEGYLVLKGVPSGKTLAEYRWFDWNIHVQ